MTQTLKGKLTIGRPSRGDGVEQIEIRLKDVLSNARFLTIVVDPATFALAVTGLSEQEVKFEVEDLDKVGLRKERRAASLVIEPGSPLQGRDKEMLRAHLRTYHQEDGWMLDDYLATQSSVEILPGGFKRVNFSYFRYVPVEHFRAAATEPAPQ